MTRIIQNILLFSFLVVFLWRCKDKYDSPYKSPSTGYLVVEGYITGNGPTQFTLSRTVALSGNRVTPPEKNASVQVEGDDNSIFPLTEQSNGIYVRSSMGLNATTKYRLRIKTSDGKEYLSDAVPYKQTPAIDSVSWTYNAADGVKLYVNTHDPSNATHYYLWQYNETWQYHSAEYSLYKYLRDQNKVVDRPDSEQIYFCWKNAASTRLILGNSTRLTQDVIYLQLLDQIPPNTQPIGILFSIMVNQYALTEDGYNFLTLMQKNSETLGSIFDAQPSALKGNIHCLSNPNEQVIGFVSAGTLEQKRLFIYQSQIPDWRYYTFCSLPDTVVGLDSASLKQFFANQSYIPLEQHYPMGGPPDGWVANVISCADCRIQGGTTTKPDFWPY
ncbi:MAG TPA: DUF4249 domain-containing protein [Puia sp.]|jgi:hypothetical protein|nr:DUF4249 domain-containing protein [Puia sp.]